jgi:hypothetical protein
MKRIFGLIFFLCSWFTTSAQVIINADQLFSSSPPVLSFIDRVEIDGIRPASSRNPRLAIAREDSVLNLNAHAYLQDVEVTSAASYVWNFYDATSTDTDPVASYVGSSIAVTSLPLGEYDVHIIAGGLNTIERYFARGCIVEKKPFRWDEADLQLDLNQFLAGTWSVPGGLGLSVTQGTNGSINFGDVVRPGFKIAVRGDVAMYNIDWIGLRGSPADPVRIQNIGLVQVEETTDGVAWAFGNGCQYFTIDGGGSGYHSNGFEFTGRDDTGTQSQMIYLHGNFIAGFKMFNVSVNQTRDVYGFTNGGACIQFSTTQTDGTVSASCNGNIGDAGYWSAVYFKVFNCTITNARDEGIYVGYFQDNALTGIYRPYRTGEIFIGYNYISHTGRDPIQVALTDEGGSVVHNYLHDNAHEAVTDHNSAISWNGGNRGTHHIAFNFAEEVDNFTSAQQDDTGNGNYLFYSNVGIQRTSALSSPTNQFFYAKWENTASTYHLELWNNTFYCSDVVYNPIALQFDAPSTAGDATTKIAHNVFVTSGSNDSPYPELRDIGLPSDRTLWSVTNTYRRIANESELLLGADYRPVSKASPIFGEGIDLTSYQLIGYKAGLTLDADGYSLLVDRGGLGVDYSAGAYSGQALYVVPDLTPPTFSTTEALNTLTSSTEIHAVANEAVILYYVFVADGAGAPSASQVFNGQNSSGAAALFSGNTIADGAAVDVTKLVTGLSTGTSYDIYIVAKDTDDNEQVTATKIDITTLSSGVVFEEAGAGVSVTGSGDLNVAYPTTGLAAGETFMIVGVIRANGGTIATPAGWTKVGTDRILGSSSNGTMCVFIKTAIGSESGTVALDFSTNSVAKGAQMFRFAGANATEASATESVANAGSTNAAVNDVGVTSTVSGTLAINVVGVADDNAIDAFTGQTGGTWVEATGEYLFQSNGTIQVQYAELPVAGTINGGSYTMAASDAWGIIGFVLKP